MDTEEIKEAANTIVSSGTKNILIHEIVDLLSRAAFEIDRLRTELSVSECTCERLRKEHQESHQQEIDNYKKELKGKVSESNYKHLTGDE